MVVRKVLLLVSELHLRGYQLLRALPAMSPSGTSWRCWIAPASLVSSTHGARLAENGWESPLAVAYTSAAEDEYFKWTDAGQETPSGLARKFIQRFPDVVAAGRGRDWLYAGWYVEMLGLTYPNRFPYASADWEVPEDYLPTITIGEDGGAEVHVPLPPLVQV